jgi:Protein of unknown function (DUF3102)
MTKVKKIKSPKRRTALGRIAVRLRAMLRRETKNIIEIGKLLIESRKLLANEHGEWLPWLEENFDLSERTARRYSDAAAYAASKSDSVSDFSNLAPTVLYWLAAGTYNEKEEAAILAATRKGRVDQDAAAAICEALAPTDDDDADEDDGGEAEAAEDPEIAAIFDDPPKVPDGSTENLATPDFALRDFDQAISVLKRLTTKSSAQFASTVHTTGDLESVESFIRAVRCSPPIPGGEGADDRRHRDPSRCNGGA